MAHKDKPANRIKIEISDQLPDFVGDERLIKQLLLNLLSNAVKFTPDGGLITVRVWQEDSGAIGVSITDTGCGIAQHEIPMILEPFGQSPTNIHHAHAGTGLGLSISKGLAELHHGTFRFESQLNVGTVVTIIFPGPTNRLRLVFRAAKHFSKIGLITGTVTRYGRATLW